MTTWLVGYRDGDEIGHEDLEAPSAGDAAAILRSARPDCLIAAVIPLPVEGFGQTIAYSDVPAQYGEIKRFTGPATGPHGYLVVSVRSDGHRNIFPNRPVSLSAAQWLRDWLLRSHFQGVARAQAMPSFPATPAPVIVTLAPVGVKG